MSRTETAERVAALLRQAGEAADDRLALAETAVALGALDRPGVPLDPYFAHLAELSRDLAAMLPADLALQGIQGAVLALRETMAGLHRYQGDAENYDDLQNANLPQVIDRRRGLPVALGILYIHAARGQGWAAAGLNFPGHFLVRIDLAGERAIVDPFNAGVSRAPSDLRDMLKLFVGNAAELQPEHYAPVPDRDILLRLQNNLKLRHIKAGQLDRAARVLDSMLTIAPNRAIHWREAGLINAKLGLLTMAIAQLERFLALDPGDPMRGQTQALLRELKARMN